MQQGLGFTRLTSDGVVNEGKTLLYGLHVEATAAGGDVSIYEGLDASSGRLIGVYGGSVGAGQSGLPAYPLFLDRGLFVDIGTNVTAVTLYWLPALDD